jgi:hypothetical protein
LEVGSLIEELARTQDGRDVIPPQLWSLWAEIKACIGEFHEPARPT